MKIKRLIVGILTLLVIAAVMVPSLMAQSLTSGEVTGTVTDPSRAVVPNATVTLKSLDTGATQQTTTTGSGYYRFTLLRPGNYQVSVAQPGFATTEVPVAVALGQATAADVTLQITKGAQTVEVSGEAVPVITETPAISTSYTQEEVQSLPNPGGDITNIAQTTPGAVMNNTGGYGNFTVNGLPATSNLFTVNGENDMDPYFNINNSGATNLTLGSGEVQEATIVANPYSGEYGQLSGAQVNMITKSGTNAFHGTAQYWWNGRAMNSNNWLTKNNDPTTNERPFSNANQWLANVGGPIVKNKLFFFVDTEGLRFVLPNVIATNVPTPAFASAVLNNVQALQPGEFPLYQQMFNLFANAKGVGTAQPIPNNSQCTGLNLPGFNGATQNCFATFNATPSALAKEWILAFKIDYTLSDKDRVSGRYKLDHGVQPSYLDPISSNFDALSNQPSWDLQLQETHVFSPNVTNEFTAAGSHYVAQFAQNEALALSTFPQALNFGGTNLLGPPSNVNRIGLMSSFPQGRNITQYQFIDNLSWNKGHHSFKFGGNFRRYDVSDHNFFYVNPATYFSLATGSENALQAFTEGRAGQYRQADTLASNVPIALWGLGVYGMDEWKVSSNLSLTLALRVERNSNPVCQINCFANYKTTFPLLPSVQAGAGSGDVPYTSDIAYNQHQAYPGVDSLLWSPRIGFRWDPYKTGKTVISGGFGMFYDSPPAGLVDNLLTNPPVSVTFRIRPTGAGTNGTLPFLPASDPNSAVYAYNQSAAIFNTGFPNNATFNQLHAALKPFGVNFAGPAFAAITGTLHAPRWQEWSFSLQQELTPSTALILSYAGNHGIRIPYNNSWYNEYDPGGLYEGLVPSAPATLNYGVVGQVSSGAVSNYNGITLSLRRNFSKYVSAHLNYTWAHNMDELSNGGIFTYGDSLAGGQICPGSLKQCNYGSSDYDVRNSFNGDFVFHPTFHVENKFASGAVNGWEFTGKLFWRSGLPFSIEDGNTEGSIVNGSAPILGYPVVPGAHPGQGSCGSAAASLSGAGIPCLDSAAFVDSASSSFAGYPTFSPQRRNQYIGPHFFDMDMSLFKNFKLGERVNFGLGLTAFNVFNHPNFSNPDAFLGDSTFGQISAMQPLPTSPYGVFLGFDSSVRVVQVSGKITF